MKLVLETNGGFAGSINRRKRVLLSEALNDKEYEDLIRMIQDLENSSVSQQIESTKMRDSIVFSITYEKPNKKIIFQQTDFALTEAFGNLMRFIEQHS
jgi:hypothetical protein